MTPVLILITASIFWFTSGTDHSNPETWEVTDTIKISLKEHYSTEVDKNITTYKAFSYLKEDTICFLSNEAKSILLFSPEGTFLKELPLKRYANKKKHILTHYITSMVITERYFIIVDTYKFIHFYQRNGKYVRTVDLTLTHNNVEYTFDLKWPVIWTDPQFIAADSLLIMGLKDYMNKADTAYGRYGAFDMNGNLVQVWKNLDALQKDRPVSFPEASSLGRVLGKYNGYTLVENWYYENPSPDVHYIFKCIEKE